VKLPHLKLGRRATAIAAVTGVIVVGLGGWALADGDVPLVSSSTDAPSSTTVAGGNIPDNVAGAVNTGDGKTVYAISLKIVQTDAATMDATNAAVAVASCTDCQTVAIALEGVLVIGSPTTFDPTNLALAINSGCTNCQTLAAAYQEVVQNDTRVRISGSGRQQIAAVRKDLESLRNSGLDIFAVQQRVNEDAAKFLAVLQNDVYPIGRPRLADGGASTTTTSTAPTANPAPDTTSTTIGSTTTSVSTTSTTSPTTTTR
jgi:putative peptide zinc metalloprotease protein